MRLNRLTLTSEITKEELTKLIRKELIAKYPEMTETLQQAIINISVSEEDYSFQGLEITIHLPLRNDND